MILVVGSTGHVGGEVCRLLRKKRHPVKALVRHSADPSKIQNLRNLGVELVEGDLKDPGTLDLACTGVATVISTASATISKQEGDNLESVDLNGQLNLVHAAARVGVSHYVYVSFSGSIDDDFPLRNAKRAVENRIKESGMDYTILRPTFFIEVWLGPHLGFDYVSAKARIYGTGNNKTSWISLSDVAKFVVEAVENAAARNKVIELGGPAALSPLEVVRIFENLSGRKFEINHVSEEDLRRQRATATDPMQQTFAGLMLAYAKGDPIEMTEVLRLFPLTMTAVSDYAKRVLGKS